MDQQNKRQQSDLLVVQRQIQGLQLQQLKQEELITEANGEIADVRSWQTNMGQKLVDGQFKSLVSYKSVCFTVPTRLPSNNGCNKVTLTAWTFIFFLTSTSQTDDKVATNIVDVEEHFLTEALKGK